MVEIMFRRGQISGVEIGDMLQQHIANLGPVYLSATKHHLNHP